MNLWKTKSFCQNGWKRPLTCCNFFNFLVWKYSGSDYFWEVMTSKLLRRDTSLRRRANLINKDVMINFWKEHKKLNIFGWIASPYLSLVPISGRSKFRKIQLYWAAILNLWQQVNSDFLQKVFSSYSFQWYNSQWGLFQKYHISFL